MLVVSRELSRALRWRHAGFRRRRLPYLLEVWCKFPLQRLTFPFRRPDLYLVALMARRAGRQGLGLFIA